VNARERVKALWSFAVRTARLAIGVPDYDTYVAHRKENHPGEAFMSYREFWNERQAARYGKGRSRCC
jgi:uncharacterized short protein YbdD (DUF466 family)